MVRGGIGAEVQGSTSVCSWHSPAQASDKRLLLKQPSRGDVAARLCPGRALEWRQRRGGEKKVAETLQGGEVSLPLCASVEVKLQT